METRPGEGNANRAAASASMGFGVTLTKKWGRPPGVPAMGVAGWQLTAGGLFLLPITLLFEGLPTVLDAGALVGYAWLEIYRRPAQLHVVVPRHRSPPGCRRGRARPALPLIAATLAALLVGERLGAVQLLGFALAMSAIAAGQEDG